jgi:hypothetical protein
MSYDSDYENIYMVEFKSGKTIHVAQFTLQDVQEWCEDNYPDDTINTIYKQVFFNDDEDGRC